MTIIREEWRVVASHPDYAVSSLGNVKRVQPDRYGRGAGRMMTPVVGNHGYSVVTLHNRGRQRTLLIHRLVCEAFHGPRQTTSMLPTTTETSATTLLTISVGQRCPTTTRTSIFTGRSGAVTTIMPEPSLKRCRAAKGMGMQNSPLSPLRQYAMTRDRNPK